MIVELPQAAFSRCIPLIDPYRHVEIKAIVAGNNPGRIFVDHMTLPSTGLVWLGDNDGFFFIGNEANESFHMEINNFIDRVIAPEAKQVDLNWFEGLGNHPKWDKTIKEVFRHRKLESWNQKVYRMQKEDFKASNEPELEQGYQIEKVTEKLYHSATISNLSFLHNKITETWPDPVNFFKYGIGYCVMYQKEIVSICLSNYIAENIYSIAIETQKDHRGKKLAQKAAHAFVKDCLQSNLVPYWDCMEENKPSMAVAESVGFTHAFHYIGYAFAFDK